jgi:predicted Na+-dependent transporter
MNDVLVALSNVSTLLMVVTSMLSLGLSLTVPQIVTPLRSWRFVTAAVVANFILAPALGLIIAAAAGLAEPLRAGLLLVALSAGAPFIPKLAQFARSDVPASVGLMVFLMVVTIVYLPITLPVLLPGASVDPLAIASSLVLTMLVPLGGALFVRARYPEPAAAILPPIAHASNFALLLVFATSVLVNFRGVLSILGTGGIVSGFAFVAGAVAIGYLVGRVSGSPPALLALGTGQRNLSAGLLIATQSFPDPNVVVMITVTALVGMAVLFLTAGELGKRVAASAPDQARARVAMRASPR